MHTRARKSLIRLACVLFFWSFVASIFMSERRLFHCTGMDELLSTPCCERSGSDDAHPAIDRAAHECCEGLFLAPTPPGQTHDQAPIAGPGCCLARVSTPALAVWSGRKIALRPAEPPPRPPDRYALRVLLN
jgi:hypothetical protein